MWGNRWNVWVLTISATGKSFYYIHFTDKKIRTGKCGNLGCHNQQPQIGWCDTWGSETWVSMDSQAYLLASGVCQHGGCPSGSSLHQDRAPPCTAHA